MAPVFQLFCLNLNPVDYCNQKGYYSIIMQSLIDFRGISMDAYVG